MKRFFDLSSTALLLAIALTSRAGSISAVPAQIFAIHSPVEVTVIDQKPITLSLSNEIIESETEVATSDTTLARQL